MAVTRPESSETVNIGEMSVHDKKNCFSTLSVWTQTQTCYMYTTSIFLCYVLVVKPTTIFPKSFQPELKQNNIPKTSYLSINHDSLHCFIFHP